MVADRHRYLSKAPGFACRTPLELRWGSDLAHDAHRSWPAFGAGFATCTAIRMGCCPTRVGRDVGVDALHHRPMPLDAVIARQDAAAEWPDNLRGRPNEAFSEILGVVADNAASH